MDLKITYTALHPEEWPRVDYLSWEQPFRFIDIVGGGTTIDPGPDMDIYEEADNIVGSGILYYFWPSGDPLYGTAYNEYLFTISDELYNTLRQSSNQLLILQTSNTAEKIVRLVVVVDEVEYVVGTEVMDEDEYDEMVPVIEHSMALSWPGGSEVWTSFVGSAEITL